MKRADVISAVYKGISGMVVVFDSQNGWDYIDINPRCNDMSQYKYWQEVPCVDFSRKSADQWVADIISTSVDRDSEEKYLRSLEPQYPSI